ncbi:MAG: hypothetical protein RIC55_05735 [Pirellulaceae bacterium]
MHGFRLLLLSILAMMLPIAARGGEPDVDAAPPILASGKPCQRGTISASQSIAVIIEHGARGDCFDKVAEAMRALGEVHCTEAVDVLVSHIGYPLTGTAGFVEEDAMPHASRDRPTPLAFSAPIERRCPAVDALVEIGEPCIDAVIEHLANTDDATQRRACVAVLERLDRRTVQRKIDDALKSAAPTTRNRLVHAAMSLVAPQPRPSVEEVRRRLKQIVEPHNRVPLAVLMWEGSIRLKNGDGSANERDCIA